MEHLLRRTAELVDVASVSHHEADLADLVEAKLRANARVEVTRIGENLVARTRLGHATRVILGGHLDTVPPNGNETAEIRGDRVYGCGSADMKGGVAILVDLVGRLTEPRVDVTVLLYAREEIARSYSGLLEIESVDPGLLEGDVAILLEPTNAIIEAGCQGTLRVCVTIHGQRAHSARPWTGVNAIHRAAPLLARIAGFEERTPTIDGCVYHETLQVVRIEGGVAANVVPDRVEVVIGHRFAPDRSIDEAYATVVDLIAPALDADLGDAIELVDAAPAARPSLDHDMLSIRVRESGAGPVAKLGWTDVAFFAERGIPAANFGPGDPLVAHHAGEFVTMGDLERVERTLSQVLGIAP